MARTKQHGKVYKAFNIILTIILLLILVFLAVNAVWSMVDSTYVFSIFGYQFYTVITDSMVPTIPVGSLVISKNVTKKTEFKRGDIITFNTKHQLTGQKMVVTHYFRETIEAPDGRTQYVTYPEMYKDSDDTDGFFVERSDIRGKYVTHLPWVGKLALFLKSPIAIVMYGVIIVIILFASYYVKKLNKENPKSKPLPDTPSNAGGSPDIPYTDVDNNNANENSDVGNDNINENSDVGNDNINENSDVGNDNLNKNINIGIRLNIGDIDSDKNKNDSDYRDSVSRL